MNLPDQIRHAAQLIREGGIAAFPTETVYGIGANALDAQAVAKIYTIKGRPEKNPLIVHVANLKQLQEVVADTSTDTSAESFELAQRLIAQFWPGPLTLIFRKKEQLPDIVTAGLETVAVRMPSHPIALELIRQAGLPVAAPSANPSGKPSATHHSHIQRYFGPDLFVIEGGHCPIGVESTVLYLISQPPKILRQGGLEQEEIERVLGKKFEGVQESRLALSPGMLFKHYSPTAQVLRVEYSDRMGEDLHRTLEDQLAGGKKTGALVTEEYAGFIPEGVHVINLGSVRHLDRVAAGLFAGLIEMDQQQVDVIVVQSYPELGLGKAIMDRLRKAGK
jgi:L-threonylcarbamoyladenylate synthase